MKEVVPCWVRTDLDSIDCPMRRWIRQKSWIHRNWKSHLSVAAYIVGVLQGNKVKSELMIITKRLKYLSANLPWPLPSNIGFMLGLRPANWELRLFLLSFLTEQWSEPLLVEGSIGVSGANSGGGSGWGVSMSWAGGSSRYNSASSRRDSGLGRGRSRGSFPKCPPPDPPTQTSSRASACRGSYLERKAPFIPPRPPLLDEPKCPPRPKLWTGGKGSVAKR